MQLSKNEEYFLRIFIIAGSIFCFPHFPVVSLLTGGFALGHFAGSRLAGFASLFNPEVVVLWIVRGIYLTAVYNMAGKWVLPVAAIMAATALIVFRDERAEAAQQAASATE